MPAISDFKSTLKSTSKAPPAGPAKGVTATRGATTAERAKRSIAVFGRLAYPNLVEPNDQSQKYDVVIIIEPDESTLADLVELIGDNAELVCGERVLPQRFFNPLRDGDETAVSGNGYAMRHEAFRGNSFVRAKSGFAPKCFWGPRRIACEASEIRGGDWAVVELTAFGFNNQSAGVGLSLNAIWLVKKGDVVIERGGSGGASFSAFDTSRLSFDMADEEAEAE